MVMPVFRVSVGKAALSFFRLDKLRAALQAAAPDVSLADARHWYFAELAAPLAKDEAALLDRILGLDGAAGEPGRHGVPGTSGSTLVQPLLVVPRLGTISPWSSKATDIAQHCALPTISRIERGVAYYFKTATGRKLAAAELQAILPLLHDRMTESVLHDLDGAAEKIFQHGVPQPLSTVDILGGGCTALEAANRDMGLALSADEIAYLVENFRKL
ncbi:MAG: phosphoribosylformylglycinamidine synthase, partial [Gallionellaceae bacterium]